MTDLLGDLDNAVQSFEGLQRALLKAEASASKEDREVMASALFAMRYTATLMMRQVLDYRYAVKRGTETEGGE